MNYVKVYVEHSALSLNQLFTYSCDEPVQPGCRVVVPFGPRELTAIVAELAKEPETSRKILPVSQVLDKTPLLNDDLGPENHAASGHASENRTQQSGYGAMA